MTAAQRTVKTNDIIQLGVLGAVAYLLYRLLNKSADIIAQPIADAAIKFLIPAPVNVRGMIVLQDSGKVVSPNQYPVGYDGTVVVQGIKYALGPHDANGNWPAVRV